MEIIKVTFLVAMLAALGGCMVVPVNPGSPRHYAPAYVVPSVGIGIYGGGRGGGYDRGYDRRYDRGYERH